MEYENHVRSLLTESAVLNKASTLVNIPVEVQKRSELHGSDVCACRVEGCTHEEMCKPLYYNEFAYCHSHF